MCEGVIRPYSGKLIDKSSKSLCVCVCCCACCTVCFPSFVFVRHGVNTELVAGLLSGHGCHVSLLDLHGYYLRVCSLSFEYGTEGNTHRVVYTSLLVYLELPHSLHDRSGPV